ncbi:GIY-YIG nuclease family protein [Vibrio viridaestus]|uniref:GIY-YIG nuclease family protein n=1 Tax=Vibrio viridaestus TaxID=2487322 RepID=A0A3N9TCY4_9VIBR|nr:GIY-YIG nuclease family protein [Vibrio viridaestus]RQW61910.1 GIY-YIG nuclease family protein [Vibrio viridaestus]
MKYRNIESLEEFIKEVNTALFNEDSLINFKYPSNAISPWDSVQLDLANSDTLNSLAGTANIYAIFTAENSSDSFKLRYIGKTKKNLARQRIRNHLITKNERTGAKLEKIISHVTSGGSVKISWVSIEPESLRNYIEEELINYHKGADWNRENA